MLLNTHKKYENTCLIHLKNTENMFLESKKTWKCSLKKNTYYLQRSNNYAAGS